MTLRSPRMLSSLLAGVGGLLVVLAVVVIPTAKFEGVTYRIFDTDFVRNSIASSLALLVLAVAAPVVALTLGNRNRSFASGAVAAAGIALFLAFLGSALNDYGSGSTIEASVQAGPFVGMLGGALVTAAGLILLIVRGESSAEQTTWERGEGPAPAGWYPDPSGADGLRYWTGESWSEQSERSPTAS